MNQGDIMTAMETFGQVKRNGSIESEGTGLGLPLAKGLIESHGGALRIESAIDEGTTVIVTWPSDRVLNYTNLHESGTD